MSEKKTLTFQLLTPMFMAGADGMRPEIRPASIKGAIRFWWRAMQNESDHKKLLEKENDLFGDSSNRQSQVQIRVAQKEWETAGQDQYKKHFRQTFEQQLKNGRTEDVKYYTYFSYGLGSTNKKSQRLAIKEGQSFGVELRFSSESEEVKKETLKALKLLHLYGCLGSKAHNGFGSVEIAFPAEVEFGTIPSIQDIRPWYTLGAGWKIFKTPSFTHWHEALEETWVQFKEARRQAGSSTKILFDNGKTMGNYDRHSKPYFLKIHTTSNEQYYGQVLSLPIEFPAKNPQASQAQKTVDQELYQSFETK